MQGARAGGAVRVRRGGDRDAASVDGTRGRAAGFLAAILLLALALRLAGLRDGAPTVDIPLINDEGDYLGAARAILLGDQGYDVRHPWMRPPGYPLLVAGLARVLGYQPFDTTYFLELVQIGLSVVTVALAYLAGRRLGGRATGLVAALLLAVFPDLIYYTHLAMSETFFVFLLMLGVVLVLEFQARGHLAWLLAGGLTLGAGALVRSSLLGLLAVIALWLVWSEWRRSSPRAVGYGVLLLAAAAIIILPWTARNLVVHQRLILIDTTAGFNLWQDNLEPGTRDVAGAVMALENPGDRQALALREGVAAIGADPGRFAMRALDRMRAAWLPDRFSEFKGLLLNKYPEASSLSLSGYAQAGTGFHLLVVLLALLALLAPRSALPPALGWRETGALWLGLPLVQTLQTGLTHYEARYRLPVLALLALPGAAGLVGGGKLVRLTVPGPRGVGLALMVGLLLWGAYPATGPDLSRDLASQARFLAGSALEPLGLAATATSLYARAAAIDPGNGGASAALGDLLARRGDTGAALGAYGLALTLRPDDPYPRLRAGELRRELGDHAGAAASFISDPNLLSLHMQRWAWDRFVVEPRSAIDVGWDDLGYVREFQAPERDESGTWLRWSRARSLVRLFPGGATEIEIRYRHARLQRGAAPTAVWRGADLLGYLPDSAGRWEVVRLPLPAETGSDEPLVLTLVSRPFRPADLLDTGDRRELGVQVARVRAIEPCPGVCP